MRGRTYENVSGVDILITISGGEILIERILRFFGTNEIILGIVSIMGIVGFVLTIVVTIRTANVSKVLKYNQITDQYNKDRIAYLKTFKGHRTSILNDNIHSEKILKDILEQVESYRIKYYKILTLGEKITLFLFLRLLKKEVNKVNWNTVCNYLAKISGRLSKKGDKING